MVLQPPRGGGNVRSDGPPRRLTRHINPLDTPRSARHSATVKATPARPTARGAILEAASRLVLRDGVSHLTLEAVAAEAGVSKGGLLYHFRTKDALIRGMLALEIWRFEEEIAARIDPTEPTGGRVTRAYVRATFEPTVPLPPDAPADVGPSLIAAIANDPELLAPLREHYADLQRRIEADGIDPARATLARLAADGLWLTELLGLAPPTGALGRQVLAVLLELTKGVEP